MIWLTADWHLGDPRLELLERPYANIGYMFQDLKKKHNSIVSETDDVIVVGDVIATLANDKSYWLDRINEFNGKKTLIKGNHDNHIADETWQKYFEKIVPEGDGLEMDLGGVKCWITHYPTMGRETHFTICGHIHALWRVQKNAFNCGVDANHFFPTSSEKIPYYLKAIESYYDEDAWAYMHPSNKFHEKRGKKGTYFRKAMSENK